MKIVLNEYAGKNVAIVAHRAPQLALDVFVKTKNLEKSNQRRLASKKRVATGLEIQERDEKY